jgi:hypothetical protein
LPDLAVAMESLFSQVRTNLDHVQTLALFDQVTGLANRTSFCRQVERLLIEHSEEGAAALFFIDLDGFKSVNDTLGHAAGDQLLARVAGRLREVVMAQVSAGMGELGQEQIERFVQEVMQRTQPPTFPRRAKGVALGRWRKAAARPGLVRESLLLLGLAAAFLQYYFLDVLAQIESLPHVIVFVGLPPPAGPVPGLISLSRSFWTGSPVQYPSGLLVKNWVWYVGLPLRSDWRMISAPAGTSRSATPQRASR